MSADYLPRWYDWLFRIRYRLLLVNALVVVVPLVGISVARFYEREMLRSLEDDMTAQAVLLKETILADPAGIDLPSREPTLARAAKNTRTRIRLLDSKGMLVSDSHRFGPPEGPESPPPTLLPRSSKEADLREPAAEKKTDFSDRIEVIRALAGQSGAATRIWQNKDTLYLFVAIPIEQQGKVEGVVYVTRSTNTVRAAMYRFRSKLLLILTISLSITVVLSLFLSWTISAPLARLTRTAERIAHGERCTIPKGNRRDEIGQLSRAIDTMAVNLDSRARYVQELAANISHEFKSPLTSIRGAAELLLDGAAQDPSARDKFLNNILTDSLRLDKLVSRLLELSRFEADPAPTEVFDYEALVRELAEHSLGDNDVIVEYLARTTHIRGRRAHLASALGNLIDNAQQHAAPDSPIKVTVMEVGSRRIRTSVHNQGPAIHDANLLRVWDRFFTTRANCGGTGLGLPIVKTVVSAHGGSVDVSSVEGQGTTFSFDLPKPKAD